MTEPYHTSDRVTLHHGDCLAHLRDMPDNSVDAIVTDPPYGLSNTTPDKVADTIVRWASGDREHVPEGRGFMGRPWDAFVPPPAVWDECLRVLKPGGHMAVFAGSRTQDLMGMSIRLAGFELRDSLAWIYGSGFPKSMDVSKAIDKAAGAEREVVGRYQSPDGRDRAAASNAVGAVYGRDGREWNKPLTAPASDAARQWEGFGTALKPAIEPVILARKPLDGTVAANVLAHGVGGLNIDACRVGDERRFNSPAVAKEGTFNCSFDSDYAGAEVTGRWPANVLLDEHAAQEMDRQSGVSVSNVRLNVKKDYTSSQSLTPDSGKGGDRGHNDSGGASRFFPVFKSEEGTPETKGRFPANVLLDEHAAQEMDRQSGVSVSTKRLGKYGPTTPTGNGVTHGKMKGIQTDRGVEDSGGASRFFPVFKYQAKAPKKERPVIEREDGTKVQHPTVKPLALMSWLVTLITPPGGVVLDPFAGSGTTLEAARDKGFRAVGVEADAEHCELIVARLSKDDGGLFAA